MCIVVDTATKLGVSIERIFELAAEEAPTTVNADDAMYIWYSENYLMTWVTFFCQKSLGLPQTADITKYKNVPRLKGGIA